MVAIVKRAYYIGLFVNLINVQFAIATIFGFFRDNQSVIYMRGNARCKSRGIQLSPAEGHTPPPPPRPKSRSLRVKTAVCVGSRVPLIKLHLATFPASVGDFAWQFNIAHWN